MANPAIHPIEIWRGDDAPPVIWRFPFDLAGSDFRLTVRLGERQLVRRVSTGGLAMSMVSGRVTWSYSPVDLAGLTTFRGVYELARTMPGGQTRTYVGGPITIRNLIDG